MPIVEILQELGATPLERILRLPLSDESFRPRLLTLFREYQTDDIVTWGELVATDPDWRHMALDGWPLKLEDRPTDKVRIDVEPLKLPRYKGEDGELMLEAQSLVRLNWKQDRTRWTYPGLSISGLRR